MKSFVTALSVLILTTALVINGSISAVRRLDALIPLATEAKSSPAALESLEREWRDCREIFKLAVFRDELERVDLAMTAARSFYGTSDPDFLEALDELATALEQLKRGFSEPY